MGMFSLIIPKPIHAKFLNCLGMGRLPNVEDKQATNTGRKNITEIVTTTNRLFGEVISIRPNFNGFKAAKNVIWKNLLTSL